MQTVIFSINRPYTDRILSGKKTVELRTRPPKIEGPYKAIVYETKRNGGCGKIIAEFDAENKETYRFCMGIPWHLVVEGCINAKDLWEYSDKGKKDITAISIANPVRWERPKELRDFGLTRAPQNWCYAKRKEEEA